MIKRFKIIGCPIDNYSFDDAIRKIVRSAKCVDRPTLIHFLNVAKIVKAQSNENLCNALWDGDLVLADGKPLLPLARNLGIYLPTRVNGTDLMEKLIEICENEELSIYFLGARQDIIKKFVDKMQSKHPNLIIAGYRNGYFEDNELDIIIEHINLANPNILFVGMGTPQKELFAYENKGRLKVPVIQGVGGSFDVVSGVIRRAPKWMQNWGMEWAFRVYNEPKRLFWRYLSSNTVFMVLYTKCLFNHFFKRFTRYVEYVFKLRT